MNGRPPLWNKPRAKRDHPATPEQVEAWRKCRPGDIIRVRLRTGNVQRFRVWAPRPGDNTFVPGMVYAQKDGQGPNSTVRRIDAFEIVP